MFNRMRPSIVALFLLAAWAGAAYQRAQRAFDAPSFSFTDDTRIHRSEAAMHYRYARMVASGEGIPALDRYVQAPQGVEPHREFALLMEESIGGVHWLLGRLGLPQPPFQVTVAVVIALVSSLALPLLAWTTAMLHNSWRCGVAATLLFGLSVPAWVRSSGAFVREAFGLPLMALVIALVLFDYQKPRPYRFLLIVGAAVLFFVSWFLAPFLAAILALPLIVAVGLRSDPRPLRRPLFALALALLLAGSLNAALRSRQVLVSPPGGVLAFGALVAAVGPHLSVRLRRRWSWIGMVLAAAGLVLSAQAGHDYAHVYEAVLARFRSTAPAHLSFAARAFSSGPFGAITPAYAIERLAVPALALLAGALAVAGRGGSRKWGGTGAPSLWVIVSAAGFLFLTLMMVRFSPFFVYFAAPLSAAWLRPDVGRVRRLAALGLWVPALGLAVQTDWRWDGDRGLLGQLSPAGPPASAVSIPARSRNGVVEWLRRESDPEAVLLADYALSPGLLLRTGRPIVLHSMFERRAARERARAYCETLVGTDLDAFAALCEEWKADYLLLDINALLDRSSTGLRHQGGVTALPARSVVARLLYEADTIPWVKVAYEDAFSRVFALNTGAHPHPIWAPQPPGVARARSETGSPCAGRFTFDPDWDRRLRSGYFLDEEVLERLRRQLNRGTSYARQATVAAGRGEWAAADRALAGARRVFPCDASLRRLQRVVEAHMQ